MAFASDGAVATGTVKTDELEMRLKLSGAPAVTAHVSIPNARNCEEKFNNDGKWLATMVLGSELTVVIHDGKTGSIHKQFSSAWRQLANRPFEWAYMSYFLGGFLPDDSLVLWRYVPQAVADPADESHVNLHLQRWSVEGELLSEVDLGAVSSSVGGRQPILADGLGLLWLPETCRSTCYHGIRVSGAQIQNEGDLTLPDDTAVSPPHCPARMKCLPCLEYREQRRRQRCSTHPDEYKS